MSMALIARILRRSSVTHSAISFCLPLCISPAAGYLLIISICLALVAFGFLQWPGLHLDASFFAPVVLSVASGRGWHYGGYPFFMVLQGNDNYDFHGILHVVLYGALLQCARWDTLFVSLAAINLLSCLAYFFLYLRALQHSDIPSIPLAALFSSVPAVICLGLQGRPEQLVPLLIAIPFILRELECGERVFLCLLPVFASLVFLASPLPGMGFFLLLLWALWFYFKRRKLSVGDWLFVALGLLVAATITLLIFWRFTPFHLVHWIRSVYLAGESAHFAGHYLFEIVRYKWGFTFVVPLWNLFILAMLSLGLVTVLVGRHYVLLFVLAIFSSGFLPVALDYGYAPFIPLAILVLIRRNWYLSTFSVSWLSYRLVLFLSTVMALLYLFVLLEYGIVAASHLSSGSPLAASRTFLHGLMASPSSSLAVADRDVVAFDPLSKPSLIVLGSGEHDLVGIGADPSSAGSGEGLAQRYERMFNRVIRYYLLPQKYPFLKSDLPQFVWIGGRRFDLVDSSWSQKETTLQKLIRPRDLSADYRFALYRRRE